MLSTVNMPKLQVDPVMRKAASIFEASGKSLDQLGADMCYEGAVALFHR
jgi:hypothetical protein